MECFQVAALKHPRTVVVFVDASFERMAREEQLEFIAHIDRICDEEEVPGIVSLVWRRVGGFGVICTKEHGDFFSRATWDQLVQAQNYELTLE